MGPEFSRYVSAVEGRLVTRWDTQRGYVGARKSTPDEVAAGADVIVWDLDHVVPLTKDFCSRFDKELRGAIRRGDLVERTAKDYEAWLALEEKREADAEAVRAEAAKKAAAEEAAATKAADQPATEETKGGDKPRTQKPAPTSAKEY